VKPTKPQDVITSISTIAKVIYDMKQRRFPVPCDTSGAYLSGIPRQAENARCDTEPRSRTSLAFAMTRTCLSSVKRCASEYLKLLATDTKNEMQYCVFIEAVNFHQSNLQIPMSQSTALRGIRDQCAKLPSCQVLSSVMVRVKSEQWPSCWGGSRNHGNQHVGIHLLRI